jgi:hypothetical protein
MLFKYNKVCVWQKNYDSSELVGFLGWPGSVFVWNSIFLCGFFIFQTHIHPIIQLNPLFWVRLNVFGRVDRICPIYIHIPSITKKPLVIYAF